MPCSQLADVSLHSDADEVRSDGPPGHDVGPGDGDRGADAQCEEADRCIRASGCDKYVLFWQSGSCVRNCNSKSCFSG